MNSKRLHPNGSAELAEQNGGTVVRAHGKTTVIAAPLSAVRAILSAAGGGKTPLELRERCPGEQSAALIDALERAGALDAGRQDASTPLRVEVVGSGPLADAITARLGREGWKVTPQTDPAADTMDLRIWAREGVRMEDALAANTAALQSGVATLVLTREGDEVHFGPLLIPGMTACLDCVLQQQGLQADVVRALGIGAVDPALATQVADDLLAALRPLPGPCPLLFQRMARSLRGKREPLAVWPQQRCACAAVTPVPGPFDVAAALALTGAPAIVSASEAMAPLRVGVVGGGSAGYLAALAILRHRPNTHVTLIESSQVPVIGVGEATTPALVHFLLEVLGIDELRLHREVAPTLKLGIRFLWGESADFLHPFSGEHLLAAIQHGGTCDFQSFGALLMRHHRAPVLRDREGRVTPLLSSTPYALHLDNQRFVAFLTRLAKERGVEHVDALVEGVRRKSDGNVGALCLQGGEERSFDLYVDATGFRSRLLGEAMGVPYQSFASTLLTDAAWVADVPQNDCAPYTTAETMDAGWCWTIPQKDIDHRGYVFASQFSEPSAALAEMARKNPGMGEARLVRFKSGRHRDWWTHNVAALGNAYAFVEPLESTALHMVVQQIEVLVRTLCQSPQGAPSSAVQARANETVGDHWDTLRGFLALHYRFNRRLDTPFWKHCRTEVVLGRGADMVEAFQRGAPLSTRQDHEVLASVLLKTPYFGLLGVDNVLLGQGVPTSLLRGDGDLGAFDRWMRHGVPMLLEQALPHREGLAAYLEWLEAQR